MFFFSSSRLFASPRPKLCRFFLEPLYSNTLNTPRGTAAPILSMGNRDCLHNDIYFFGFAADFYACSGPDYTTRPPVLSCAASAGLAMPGVAACTRARVPGASAVEVDEAIRQAQPRAVPATACCTATDGMLHHLRAQPNLAARRTAGGARNARTRTRFAHQTECSTIPSAPHLPPSTMRRCGPAVASSRYVARATRSAAPSTSAPHGCGWPVRVNGETSVASQHNAIPSGIAP